MVDHVIPSIMPHKHSIVIMVINITLYDAFTCQPHQICIEYIFNTLFSLCAIMFEGLCNIDMIITQWIFIIYHCLKTSPCDNRNRLKTLKLLCNHVGHKIKYNVRWGEIRRVHISRSIGRRKLSFIGKLGNIYNTSSSTFKKIKGLKNVIVLDPSL